MKSKILSLGIIAMIIIFTIAACGGGGGGGRGPGGGPYVPGEDPFVSNTVPLSWNTDDGYVYDLNLTTTDPNASVRSLASGNYTFILIVFHISNPDVTSTSTGSAIAGIGGLITFTPKAPSAETFAITVTETGSDMEISIPEDTVITFDDPAT